MPLQFEPVEFFKRGSHHAIEVDRERLESLGEPLDMARTYAEVEPLVLWLRENNPDTSIAATTFFEGDDGYPTSLFLQDALIDALRVDGAEDIGLGIYGAIHASELVFGNAPFDAASAVSPEWLEAEPDVVFRTASASDLFRSIQFDPEIDEDAISDVTDAYDMGDLQMEVATGDFLAIDVLDEWKRELARRLAAYYDALKVLSERDAWVANWYDDKP